MPHNSVTSVLQARDGYLWVGTLGGLARFDGVRFVTVWPEGRRAGGPVNDSRITGLCEDDHGNLWAGTEEGVLRFYPGGHEKLTTAQGLADNHVTAIAQQTNGAVWFGTQQGLSRWQDGAFQTLTERDGLPHNRVTGLHVGPSGILWISTQTGLCQYERRRLSPCLLGMEASARGMGYFGIYEDQGQNLWTFGDTFLLNLSRGRRFNYFRSSAASLSRVWTLFETRRGDLLVGTDSRGLFRFRDGSFTPVNLSGASVIEEIKAIAEDREGNLWIGTRGNGLCRLKRTRLANYALKDEYRGAHITAVAGDPRGGVWLATQMAGLFHRGENLWEPSLLRLQGVPVNNINTLLMDARDNLWLGTWGQGLVRLDPQGNLTAFGLASGLPDTVLTALASDARGNLFVGTREGTITRFRDGVFTPMPGSESRLGKAITALVAGADDMLWYGSDGAGLGCLGSTHPACWSETEGLASAHVRALYMDTAGRLWVGTDKPGLACLDQGSPRHFGAERGLPDVIVNQILEDREGNLWLGCQRGLCQILRADLEALWSGRPERINVVRFDKDDGMVNLECASGYGPSACRTKDGRLWFPAAKGLIVVDPAAAPLNPVAPPVVIEQVLADGAAVFEAAAYAPVKPAGSVPPPCLIRSGKKSMTFRYAALSYTSPEKVRFRYRLTGLDPEWIEAGEARLARYPKLPPGPYEFRVTACNNDGRWNPEGGRIALTVLPPYWQTWWFLGVAAAGSVSAVAGGARYWMFRRLRRRLRLLEQQHALEKERSRIARDMHDEIGARLTQISFLCELVKRDLDHPAEARKDLDRMSGAAREVIKGLEEIVWTVNPKHDSLDDLATYLTRYAQEFFQGSPIACTLDIPLQLPAMPLSADVRHNLFLAVKEALNNIVKHAGASAVKIQLSVGPRSLCHHHHR